MLHLNEFETYWEGIQTGRGGDKDVSPVRWCCIYFSSNACHIIDFSSPFSKFLCTVLKITYNVVVRGCVSTLYSIFSHTDFVLMLMDPISYASDALKAMSAGTVCNPCVYYLCILLSIDVDLL